MAQPGLVRVGHKEGGEEGEGADRLICAHHRFLIPRYLLQSHVDQYLSHNLPKACPIVARARLRLGFRVRVRERASGWLGFTLNSGGRSSPLPPPREG